MLAAPLAIWAIPILDSSAAIMRRKCTGRSIYITDRAHMHHRLMERWGSNRRTLAFVAVCCLLTSVAGLLSLFWRNDLIALITCGALIALLALTRTFGHTEFALAWSRGFDLFASLGTPLGRRRSESYQSAVRLQGSRKWELLWETLVEWAGKMQLSEIRLDLNLPLVHEGYHASWHRAFHSDTARCWRLALPLMVAGSPIGSLLIVGEHNGQSAAEQIEKLLDLLEPFEVSLAAMASGPQGSTESATASLARAESPQPRLPHKRAAAAQ
jgi:UDP-GlcNAc:undecaprenyl-phosphate GlcNAc-1-phosphate transferase